MVKICFEIFVVFVKCTVNNGLNSIKFTYEIETGNSLSILDNLPVKKNY